MSELPQHLQAMNCGASMSESRTPSIAGRKREVEGAGIWIDAVVEFLEDRISRQPCPMIGAVAGYLEEVFGADPFQGLRVSVSPWKRTNAPC